MEVDYDYDEGEEEEHRGAKEMESVYGYSTYEHTDVRPEFGALIYKVTCYIPYASTEDHVNKYFIPAEELDGFFNNYSVTAERLIDIRPIHPTDAVEELRLYDEGIEPWEIIDE